MELALGPIGIAFEFKARKMAEDVIQDVLTKAFTALLWKNEPVGGVPVPDALAISFDTVLVKPEGLTIIGKMPITVPYGRLRFLVVDGLVMERSKKQRQAFYHHSTMRCPKGDFPATINERQWDAWCEATPYPTPYILGYPLKYKWSIIYTGPSADGPEILGGSVSTFRKEIPDGSGEIVLENIFTKAPLGAGGSDIRWTTDVHIGYEKKIDNVHFTNLVPTEGVYGFDLEVVATNPSYDEKDPSAGGKYEARFTVLFDGITYDIDNKYYILLAECMTHYFNDIKISGQRLGGISNDDLFVPRWVLVDHPNPEKLLEFILAIANSDLPEKEEILTATKLAHGISFNRALFSPTARGLFLAKKDIDVQSRKDF